MEGIRPAKLYYEKHGVTFPALVDPNYATRFGAVPKTFLIDEHGVVQDIRGWQSKLKSWGPCKPIGKEISAQWSQPEDRLATSQVAALARRHQADTKDLHVATQLASRYLSLELNKEARAVLETAVGDYGVKKIAGQGGPQSELLGQAYLQLSRACEGERELQVKHATTSYYLNPSIGLAKQISRIIAPEKFDHRPDGRFDNRFREGTYQRLRRQRAAWLNEPS